MRSVMHTGHTFSQVSRAEIQRSSFDRSSGLKTTIDAGLLIPIFADEVLPGDTYSLNSTIFGRLSTPLRPVMDNLFANTFFFFVPNRLLWSNWQRFMGEQDNPTDSVDFLVPQITSPAGGYTELSIYDYFGIPTKIAALSHSALWLRAYNLVWNQWFRDQNLQNSVTVPLGDGPDTPGTYVLLRRGKRHDYFTSSLPWPQKGSAVSIPLGTTAPITGLGIPSGSAFVASGGNVFGTSAAGDMAAGVPIAASGTSVLAMRGAAVGPGSGSNRPQVFADLSNATAATINQLRQAFQVQKLHERDARGGTRYTEIVRSHFNVVSPDARLQRAEYLGGGQTSINVHQVPQTAPTVSGSTPQGNLAAYGIASGSGHGFSKSFTEHGVILGLLSVRADLNYQQGLNRMWSRRTKLDFYWPALAHIGEQAVLQKEIFATGTAADDGAWGYQERYGEYRYKPSIVTGLMRSNSATPLDSWHLAQNFAAAPALNAAFIVDNPPIARIVAVPAEPNFIFDIFHSLRCARPMPVYGVPGLIDHF